MEESDVERGQATADDAACEDEASIATVRAGAFADAAVVNNAC